MTKKKFCFHEGRACFFIFIDKTNPIFFHKEKLCWLSLPAMTEYQRDGNRRKEQHWARSEKNLGYFLSFYLTLRSNTSKESRSKTRPPHTWKMHLLFGGQRGRGRSYEWDPERSAYWQRSRGILARQVCRKQDNLKFQLSTVVHS